MFNSNQKLCINGSNGNKEELKNALDFAIKRYSFLGNGGTNSRQIWVQGIYYNIPQKYILLKSYIPYEVEGSSAEEEKKEGIIRIPSFMEYNEAINFIANIVCSVLENMDYKSSPDIDGSIEKGWVLDIPYRFFLKQKLEDLYKTSHVDVLVIYPEWIEYHK